jgi:hypothetical protein
MKAFPLGRDRFLAGTGHALVGHNGTGEIEIEPVVDGSAFELGDQPARRGKLVTIESDPLARRGGSCGWRAATARGHHGEADQRFRRGGM